MKDEESLDSTEQCWIHGLLSDLHDPAKEARLRLVLAPLDTRPPPPHAGPDRGRDPIHGCRRRSRFSVGIPPSRSPGGYRPDDP